MRIVIFFAYLHDRIFVHGSRGGCRNSVGGGGGFGVPVPILSCPPIPRGSMYVVEIAENEKKNNIRLFFLVILNKYLVLRHDEKLAAKILG